MWSVCTELLRCMHGACITCTAMHATVRVRKFVVNKISNGPGDDFLRAPIQIMTPSNRSSSNANATTARIYAPRKSSAARFSASGRVPYRQNLQDKYARLESAARARSCLVRRARLCSLGVKTDLCYSIQRAIQEVTAIHRAHTVPRLLYSIQRYTAIHYTAIQRYTLYTLYTIPLGSG